MYVTEILARSLVPTFFVLSSINQWRQEMVIPHVLTLVSQHRWDSLLHIVFELILDAILGRKTRSEINWKFERRYIGIDGVS
jgi:hypothetical protein